MLCCHHACGIVLAIAVSSAMSGAQAQPLSLAPVDHVYRTPFDRVLREAPATDEVAPFALAPDLRRQVVDYPSREAPGTIIIDTSNTRLYYVLGGGRAVRYGIGVGREGFAWSGTAVVHDKSAWPKWFPPPEMVARDPKVAPYANGMDGGIKNPIGARALYLWQGNKDTLFRLHGTNEPSSIGHAVSSGCIRLLNQDIIDLYDRVPIGTKVVVLATPDETAQTIDFQESPVPANQL
jgi:lipoprotein-anchoring transpeptidase ErfK/SrfK